MKKLIVLICFVLGLIFVSGCDYKTKKGTFKEKVDKIVDPMNFQKPVFYYSSAYCDSNSLMLGGKEIRSIYLTKSDSLFGGKDYYSSLEFKLSEKELLKIDLHVIRFGIITTENLLQEDYFVNREDSSEHRVFDEEIEKRAFDFFMIVLDEIFKMEDHSRFIKESDEVLEVQKIKKIFVK